MTADQLSPNPEQQPALHLVEPQLPAPSKGYDTDVMEMELAGVEHATEHQRSTHVLVDNSVNNARRVDSQVKGILTVREQMHTDRTHDIDREADERAEELRRLLVENEQRRVQRHEDEGVLWSSEKSVLHTLSGLLGEIANCLTTTNKTRADGITDLTDASVSMQTLLASTKLEVTRLGNTNRNKGRVEELMEPILERLEAASFVLDALRRERANVEQRIKQHQQEVSGIDPDEGRTYDDEAYRILEDSTDLEEHSVQFAYEVLSDSRLAGKTLPRPAPTTEQQRELDAVDGKITQQRADREVDDRRRSELQGKWQKLSGMIYEIGLKLQVLVADYAARLEEGDNIDGRLKAMAHDIETPAQERLQQLQHFVAEIAANEVELHEVGLQVAEMTNNNGSEEEADQPDAEDAQLVDGVSRLHTRKRQLKRV